MEQDVVLQSDLHGEYCQHLTYRYFPPIIPLVPIP